MLDWSTLTLSAHAHVYILEKSQHKVPEEALKVSSHILSLFFFTVVWQNILGYIIAHYFCNLEAL